MLPALLAACAFFSACVLSSAEAQKVRALKQQSEDFAAKARAQYGETAAVQDIQAPTVAVNRSVWPTVTRVSAGYLTGEITVGEETFYGLYQPEEHRIYSQRNREEIAQSAVTFLDLTGLELLEVTIQDSAYAYDQNCLPDEVTTFRQLLEAESAVRVTVYTTSPIDALERTHFEALYQCYDAREVDHGCVVLVQLQDPALLEPLQNDIENISFAYKSSADTSRVYDAQAKGYVNAFEKYGIRASLYLAKDSFVLSCRN